MVFVYVVCVKTDVNLAKVFFFSLLSAQLHLTDILAFLFVIFQKYEYLGGILKSADGFERLNGFENLIRRLCVFLRKKGIQVSICMGRCDCVEKYETRCDEKNGKGFFFEGNTCIFFLI